MKSCPHCNTTKPLDAFGKDRHSRDGLTYWCRECRNARSREQKDKDFYRKHHERHKEYKADYYKRPEVVRRVRNQQLMKSFGISIDEYEKLWAKQKGLCAICEQPERTVRTGNLCVDHNHQTGVVRGLLCSHCNRGIGLLHDDPRILRKAIRYLNVKPADKPDKN